MINQKEQQHERVTFKLIKKDGSITINDIETKHQKGFEDILKECEVLTL